MEISIKNVAKSDNFFKLLTKHTEKFSSEKQCSQQCSHQSSASAQQTLNTNIITKSATTGDIIWAMKSVLRGYVL